MSTALRATQSFTVSGGDRGYPSPEADASSAVGLRDFLRSHSLPCFARVGRSGDGGVRNPTRRPRLTRDEEVFLYCVARVSYVAADEMSVVHKKHIQPTGQRFYVPLDCRAWFEVLSQDGISARPLGSVAELQAKLAVASRCLVRQSVGAYVRRSDDGGYDARIVRRGDVLTVSETVLVSSRSSGGGGGGPSAAVGKQLLRCTDRRGREVFFDLAQRGLFTPIAGSTNVTGAHNVKSLLTKFRLPVMVRLLYGNVGQAGGTPYNTGVFRLVHLFADEIVFSMPMNASRPENQRILAVPTRAKSITLRKTTQRSRDEMATMIQSLSKHCKLMVTQHLDTILSVAAICESSWLLADVEFEPSKVDSKKDRPFSSSSGAVSSADPEEEELYREIEDIYNRIANPIVPRPIVFTTGGGGGGGRNNKGLRRNVTVQDRTTSSGQKMRLVDDNWQILPQRQRAASPDVFLLHDGSCNRSEPTLLPPDVQVQADPKVKWSRPRRKTAEVAGAVPEDRRRGEHLYEEIPFFAKKKTNLDETDAEVRKATMHVTDADIRRPGSSDDGVERNAKTVKSENPDPAHDLRSSLDIQKETKPDDGEGETAPEEVPGPRDQISARPKSIAGTPLFDNEPEKTDQAINVNSDPLPRPPLSLPPKHGESTNDLVDLVVPSAGISPPPPTAESRHSPNPNSEISRTPDDPVATVERRQSSRVSTAVRTLGNASRSFLNTFRKLGGVGRSSAVLVISDPEEGKQRDAAATEEDKEPVKRISPPPQQILGDRPDVVPEGNFINGSEEELAVAGLRL